MIRFPVATMIWLKRRTRLRTWQIEACFVGSALAAVAIACGKDLVEWVGVVAVFFTWMHASVADRLAAQPHAVQCHAWARRYWFVKEALWCLYFAAMGAWSALAGVALFLAYGPWRTAWRDHQASGFTISELAAHHGVPLIVSSVQEMVSARDALGVVGSSPFAQACTRGVLALDPSEPAFAYSTVHEMAHWLEGFGYPTDEVAVFARQRQMAQTLCEPFRTRAMPDTFSVDGEHPE